MSHRTPSFAFSTSLVVFAAAWALSGCGGGGGGNKEDPPTVAPSGGTGTGTGSGTGGSGTGSSNQAPVVSVSTGSDPVAFLPVGFLPATAIDADVTITSSSFDYGDGQTGTTASHTYDKPGSYTVTYKATDSKGRTGQNTLQLNVLSCSRQGLAAAASSSLTSVCVQTTAGELVFELDTIHAPITTANFLKYVDSGFHVGTLFHRIIKGFMAQGGGFTSGPAYKTPTFAPIALESKNGLLNKPYTLAMARTDVLNSATSQFFINFVDNAHLNYAPAIPATPTSAAVAENPGYAVFGQVILGKPVVDGLGNVATGTAMASFPDGIPRSLEDVPQVEVKVLGMTRIQ